MTDRELLEMAAKAAGLHIIKHCQESRDKAGYGYVGLYVRSNNGEIASTGWNPLTDDGDALRLAIDLNLTLLPIGGGESTGKSIGCKYEFTRRAIVRAAAEIGSQMK